MSRFLRFFAFLSIVLFTSNAMAVGYECGSRKYLRCESGYYLSDCGTTYDGRTVTPSSYGNSCNLCPDGYSCSGGTTCPTANNVYCSAGTYLPANSTTCATCPAGSYCPGGTYSVGSTEKGRTTCHSVFGTSQSDDDSDDNFSIWSDEGSRYSDDCYIDLLEGYEFSEGASSAEGCYSGEYCPGGRYYYSIDDYYDNEYYGYYSCYEETGDVYTDSSEGSTDISDCYRRVSLNKSGGSGTINGTAGTSVASNVCMYASNNQCTLPDASVLTQAGYTFTGGWGTSSSCTSSSRTVTLTSGSWTYYACKTTASYTCSAGKYLPANSTTCTTCPAGSYCPGGTFSLSSSDQGKTECPSPNVSGQVYVWNGSDVKSSAAGSSGVESCYLDKDIADYWTHKFDYPGFYRCEGKQYYDSSTGYYSNCENDKWFSECNAGHYIDSSTAYNSEFTNTCTTCPAGTYGEASGHINDGSDDDSYRYATSCTSCPINTYNSNTGSTSSSACLLCEDLNPSSGVKYPKSLEGTTSPMQCFKYVTLNENGGTDAKGAIPSIKPCYYGSSCTMPDASVLTLDGYTFTGGWGTGSSCTDTNRTFSAPPDTLYACKTKASYTITYTCGEGTGSSMGDTVEYMEEYQVKEPIYCSRTGYTFAGWADDNTGDIVQEHETITWTRTSGTTYVALWESATLGCNAGTYLPANSTTCTTCTAGYYCPGGTFQYTGGVQGLYSCHTAFGTTLSADSNDSDFAISSAAGASSFTECYIDIEPGYEFGVSIGIAECYSGEYCEGGRYYYEDGEDWYGYELCSSLGNTWYKRSESGASSPYQCYQMTSAGRFVSNAGHGEVTCLAGGYCPGDVRVYYGSTGGRTVCPAGTANSNAGSSASSACVTCAAGTYNTTTGNSTCSTCPAGSYCTGGSNKTACTAPYSSSAAGASSRGSCYLTTSSGKFVNEANNAEVTCLAGGYCPGGVKVYYGSIGGRTVCPVGTANSNTGSSASSACVTCAAGTYNTTTGNSTCMSCGVGYYCTGGSARAQCTATSGWTTTTATANSTSYSACYQTQKPSGCASGSIKRTASSISGSTITYGSPTVSNSLSANANYYVSGTSCPACTGLGSFYTKSAGGAISAAGCYGTTTGGKYIKTNKSSTQETCPAGSYCPATNVYYGGYDTTGGRVPCSAGTANSNTGSSAASACVTCAAGKYSNPASASCSNVKAGCYGSAGATQECPTVCAAGKYSTGGASSCSSCLSGYNTSGTSAADHDAQSDCKTTITLHKNGGSGTIQGTTGTANATLSCSQGAACNFGSASGLALTGYTFAGGWSTTDTACSSTTTSFTNPVGTYYACKTANSYTITYTCGDGSGSSMTQTATYDSMYTVKDNQNCSRTGYVFKNWLVSGDNVERNAGAEWGWWWTENKTFVAQWEAVTYKCDPGYYLNGAVCTKCTAGYYCPGVEYTYDGGIHGRSACGAGKYSTAGASSCSNITAGCYGTSATTACPAVCADNKYSNAGASSCSSCPTDYKNSGDTAASHAGSASCKITVSGGYYIGTAGDNSSNWDKCAGGTYKASHTVAYGSTSSCTACGAGKYSAAGSTSCTNISAGCYGTSASSACPAECAAGTYAPAGSASCTACTGRTKYSAAKAGSCSTVSSGYYTTGCNTSGNNCTGQSQCTSGTYCTGGEKKTCPTGYGASAAGSDAAADCYMSVAATKYVKTANDASATACGTGTYKAAHTVYYGGTSTCNSCPTGYDDGEVASAESGCKISVAGGKYVGTANSATLSTCSAGYYKASHTVAYGSTSSCSACGAVNKYSSSGASSCSTVSSGYYTTGGTTTTRTGQSQCTSGTYCTGGEQKTCPTGYGASAAGSTEAADCYMSVAATKYVKTANDASATACGTGTYKAAHTVYYGGTSTCTSCPDGYDDGAAASAESGCKISVAGGKYVGTANSATLSTCSAGYYKASHTVAYGSTSSCSACGAVNKYSSSGASSCSTVSTGYYTTGGTTTTRTGQSQCTSGTYCTGGEQKTCPSGYGASAAGSDAAADCYMSVAAAKYVKTANDASATACGTGTYKAAHTVYYGGTSTCNSCPSGYDDGAAASAESGCKISVAGGKYVGTANSATLSTCSAGYYKASHTVAYGSTSSCSACGAVNKYSSSGASSCSTVSTGYYTTGGTTTTRTGQSQCTSGTYCTGGEKKTCPSGYGASAAGSDAAADCYMSVAATKYVKTANDASATACGTGTYKAAHTVYYGGTSSCSSCPSGYDDGAAVATQAECIISVAGGKYVGTKNSATLTDCSAGYYKAAHSVAYGSTSSCTACGAVNKYSSSGASSCSTVSSGYYTTGGTTTTRTGQSQCTGATYCSGGVKNDCPSGYDYNTTAGKTAASSCTMLVPAKYYLEKNASSPKICAGGQWNPQHERAYGASSGCNSCPTGYDDGEVASAESGCKISVAGGKYVGTKNSATLSDCAGGTYKAAHSVAYGSTSSCATCSAGYYCPEGASSQTACGGNNKYSSSGASSCSTVSSGYYSTGGTSTTRTGQTKCEAGNYCSGGVKTACGGGKYSAAGATSCSNITAGCYGTSASSSCPAVCGDNKYSDAGASSCTSCDSDYANSGTDAASHAGVASCKVTCAAGTYVASANAACTDVGSGYYTTASQTISQGSTGSRSACSSLNAFYTASDSGRNATTDCYGTTSSGKYVSTAKSGEVTCAAGGYCAGSVKVYYNSTGGRTGCGAGKYNASTGSSSSSACANITAGCYGTSASSACPAVCAANTYSNAGASSCSSCPTDYKNSGDTAASHAGSASCKITVSGGYYIGTAGDNSSNWDKCACGTYKASHTVAYGSTSSCVTTDAGYYAAAGASSQTKATAGYYAAAGACSQTACSGRTKYSAAGAASCSTVSTGYYTTGCNSSGNACTSQTICAKGTYCSSGVAYNCPGGTYGSTTGLSTNACSGKCTAGYYCPAGSTSATQNACATNATSAAGSDAISDCVCKAGYSGDASTSSGTCTACACGYYKGSTGNTSCTKTTAGYYATGTGNTGQTKATAGNYAAAGACSQSSCADLGGGLYSSSAAGSDATADCYATVPVGKYLSSATSTSFTTCTAGYYCAGKTVYYNSTGGRTGCGAGKYSAAGSDASSDCVSISAGCYGTSASSACPAKCAAGTYSTGGASACTNCENKPSNSSYTSATGNTSASCPWTCNDGYNQTADNQCGQFCTAGITHIKLGNGLSVPLYSSARTSPAINVKVNNSVCYGSLATGQSSGTLNVKVGSTTYHAIN